MSSETQRFGGHYDVVGEGLPVLCLAGFGCSNWIFDYMAQALSAHVQMIMPDNRGMGRSPHADEPYTLDDLAADALGLMDDLGIQRFAVLGISMGGFVAQSLCLQAPQRVRGLMLLCATGPGDAFVPLPQISNEMLAESYTQPVVEMIRHNTEITTSPNFERRDPEMFMRILQKSSTTWPTWNSSSYKTWPLSNTCRLTAPLSRLPVRP